MTSIPNALVGTREEPAEIRVATEPTRLHPETLMIILLALWMLIGGLICGFTALSY